MKNYNHQKIDELLQPLMKMMQEEFPNNCKLIVEPYFSQIVYEHSEMVFPSDEMKKPLCETAPMKPQKPQRQTRQIQNKERI